MAGPALALDPDHALWQYGHTAWRVQDGELPGTPNALAQGADGYLWIGTSLGPVRFDGRKFSSLADASGQPLLNETVLSLLSARDGGLWIGTQNGVWRWRAGQLKHFEKPSLTSGIREGLHGDIWYSRSRVRDGEPMGRIRDEAVRNFGPADGLPGKFAEGFDVDHDGGLWMGTVDGLVHWSDHSTQIFNVEGRRPAPNFGLPQAVQTDADGSVWAGFETDGPGFGLQHLVDGQFRSVALPGAGASPHVQALFLDHRGVLWVGTTDHGLFRIHGGQVDHFEVRDGLSGDDVSALAEDKEGNLWVGTSSGVDRFRDLKVNSISTRDGIVANTVNSLAAAPDGSTWISDLSAVEQIRNGRVITQLRVGEAADGNQFSKVFVERSGRLWVGVDDDLAVKEGGRFKRIRLPNGESLGVVVDIAQASDGDLWVVASPRSDRVVRVSGDRVVEIIPYGFHIFRLLVTPDGSMWASTTRRTLMRLRGGPTLEVATNTPAERGFVSGLQAGPANSILGVSDHGLFVLRDGRSRAMHISDGLPCQRLFGIAVDRELAVWLYGSCGVMRLTAADFDRWWTQAGTKVTAETFDASDGAQPDEIPFGTSGVATVDGLVWFANGRQLQMIDPARIQRNTVLPSVHIENVSVDHKHVTLDASLRLPANPRTLEIDYTATSFIAPRKVLFRYRLDGHDDAWQDAGARREAFYTDLPPGHYSFHVVACNDDGLWNEQGATIDFVIPQTFVQSRTFIALCILTGLLLLWLAYAARLRQIRLRLQARDDERERIAIELHDTLLQGAQGLVMVLDGRFRNVRLEDDDREALDKAVDRANDLVREGRERIYDLRMNDASLLALFGSLQSEGESLAMVNGIRFQSAWRGDDRSIAGNCSEELRRLAAEAMSNAFRHARANTVELDMDVGPRSVTLVVRDDGVGIDARIIEHGAGPGHWGLAGMRGRASRIGARLDIARREEKGTEIRIAFTAAPARTMRLGRTAWAWLRRSSLAEVE